MVYDSVGQFVGLFSHPSSQQDDPCPERDSDGYCHCKKVTHPRIVPVREPRYPLKK